MGFKIQKTRAVEASDYTAQLTEIEPAKGAYGPCLKFFFTIQGGEFDSIEVSMIRPARLQSGNKLDRTLQQMGIDTNAITDELDSDSLKGKLYSVKVENKTSAQGKVFANVTEVLAVLGDAPAAPAAPAPVPVAPAASSNGVSTPNVEDVPF